MSCLWGMLLLYFPTKCRFLSVYCSWAINEMTSVCVYVRELQTEINGRREAEEEAQGGSLLFPLLYSLITNSHSYSSSYRSVCVLTADNCMTRARPATCGGNTCMRSGIYVCAVWLFYGKASWSRPLFDRKTRWCRFVFNELDPEAREGGGKKEGWKHTKNGIVRGRLSTNRWVKLNMLTDC